MHWLGSIPCTLVLASAGGQPQDSVELRNPESKIEIPAGDIAGLHELSAGKVLIVRSAPGSIVILDFAKGTSTPIGQKGSGAGEYQVPVGLVPMPDGKIYVSDPSNSRFLILSAAGAPLDTISFQSMSPVTDLLMEAVPLVDSKGQWYFELTETASFSGDSSAIVRWSPGKKSLDTVGFTKEFLTADPLEKAAPPPPMPGMEKFGPPPGGRPLYEPQESWTIHPTGRVLRVSPKPYQVLWYEAKLKVALGPTIPYEPVPIDETEQKRIKEQLEQLKKSRRDNNNNSEDSTAESKDEIDLSFDKPPFPNRSAAMIGPNGELWVMRSIASDDAPYFDRFDVTGKSKGKVVLPKDGTLVGVYKSLVYLTRPLSRGKAVLERYRWGKGR